MSVSLVEILGLDLLSKVGSKIGDLEAENAELRDQLRWRDIKTESPTSDGRYLIVGEIGYVASDYFTLANGWTHKEMMLWTHWRPIGPLPGGE